MSTEHGSGLSPEPEEGEEDILNIAVQELDKYNADFYDTVRTWATQPSHENLMQIAEPGVRAGNAFQNVVETVVHGEDADTPEEKATLLAGVFIATVSDRGDKFKKIAPKAKYPATQPQEEVFTNILNDIKNEVPPEAICYKMSDAYMHRINADVKALCDFVSTSAKGRLHLAWEHSRGSILELGKHTTASAAGIVIGGLILKKIWEKEN